MNYLVTMYNANTHVVEADNFIVDMGRLILRDDTGVYVAIFNAGQWASIISAAEVTE